MIEGCAGGGGRYDLGILFYSPQIWPSDTSDGLERLSILIPECLNRDRHYQIYEKETISGHFLMNVGLRKPRLFNGVNHTTYQLAGDCQSFIYHLVERREMK